MQPNLPLRAAALALAAGSLCSAPAHAQRLLGLEEGFGSARLDVLNPNSCDVVATCVPLAIPTPPPPLGGVAVGNKSRTRWVTNGPTLVHLRPNCSEIHRYLVPSSSKPIELEYWTGLAISEKQGRMFFTDQTRVGELPIPDPATSPVMVDMSLAVTIPGPYPLAYPLTGVEYDPTDDTLWVIDSQYNVVHMERPSKGGLVLSYFNVGGLCGGLSPWTEGITLAPHKQFAGHPKGVLYISDGAGKLLSVDRFGAPIACCGMSLATPLAGLAKLPPKKKGGGGNPGDRGTIDGGGAGDPSGDSDG